MASANALCYKALTVFFILAQNALRDRRGEKNRPIVGDSCRSRVKFKSRDFPFEIKSEEI